MAIDTKGSASTSRKLTAVEHIFAGLPLVLMFVGGAVGGLCGGAGYACSAAVFKKEMPGALKYVLSTLIAFAAAGLYLGIIIALGAAFPGIFQRQK